MSEAKLSTLFQPFVLFEEMASVFTYPGPSYAEKVQKAYERLLEEEPEAAERMRPFVEGIEGADQGTLEHLYQATFDIQAITTLDISYVLFGDDYKRGQMLSYLQRDQVALGIDTGTELPDHLSNFLITIARLKDDVLRDDLVKKALLPALDEIIADFGKERVQQKQKLYRKYHKGILQVPEGTGQLFLYPLQALKHLLEFSIGGKEEEIPFRSSMGFIKNLDREIAVEHTRSTSF